MASARLSSLPSSIHQNVRSTRQGQVSLMRNVHCGRVRRHRQEPPQAFTVGTVCSTRSWGSSTTPVVRPEEYDDQNRESRDMEGFLHILKVICVLCDLPSPRPSLPLLGTSSGSLSAVGATRLREVLFNAEELRRSMLLFKCVAPLDRLEHDRQGLQRVPSIANTGSNREEIMCCASISKKDRNASYLQHELESEFTDVPFLPAPPLGHLSAVTR